VLSLTGHSADLAMVSSMCCLSWAASASAPMSAATASGLRCRPFWTECHRQHDPVGIKRSSPSGSHHTRTRRVLGGSRCLRSLCPPLTRPQLRCALRIDCCLGVRGREALVLEGGDRIGIGLGVCFPAVGSSPVCGQGLATMAR
jgi:hypothetical protein